MGAADHHLHALGLAQGDADDEADDHEPPAPAPAPSTATTPARPTATATENGAADDAAHAAPPIAGLLRKAALDDRPRRSMSYRHTDPYDVAVDESTGLEYEIRACKYCDTAFSFKGGTTSAALRHLRLAHPSEFYGAGGAPPPPPRALPDLLAPPSATQQQQQQQHHQTHQQSASEQLEEPRPEDQQQQHDERPDEEHPAPRQDQPHEPRAENGGRTVEAGHGEPSGANEPTAQETRPTPPRVLYHKRRRHEDDSHSGSHLTVNQLAISHFIAHYKQALPLAKRLAFVKHLAYNDREAAMYNVLDEELRLEFLTQFTVPPQTLARDA